MSGVSSTKRFDLVELALIAGLVALAVWTLKPTYPVADPSDEVKAFEATYGAARNSQYPEEWLIRDFFKERRGGVFVDVGANHHQKFSNTYYLETALGWSGIAVEPLMQFEEGYRKHRPRTKFRAFFVSDASEPTARMFVNDENPLVSSQTKEFTRRYVGNAREVTVPAITLNDLLMKEGLASVDFLSMDIELAEPKALAGFDIRRFMPELVCIEAHPEVRQQLLDYFHRNDYAVVGKYLRADEHNLYFAPVTTALTAAAK